MKKLLNSAFQLFVFAIILICCTPKKSINTVKISIKGQPDVSSPHVKISTFNMFNPEHFLLAEVKPDSGDLEFTLTNPTFASLEIGKIRNTIYLEPGYALSVLVEEKPDKSIYFTGTGAEANNYLAQISLIQSRFEQAAGKNVFELAQEGFLDRLDSLEKSMADFHQHYIDSVPLSKDLINLFEKRNSTLVLKLKQTYGWNYGTQHNFEIPESLEVMDKIPFDSTLLNRGVAEYAMMLHMYMHLKFYIPLWANRTPEEIANLQNIAPGVVKIKIKEGKYPSFIEELLLAKNIDYWMAFWGIVPSVDSVYTNFKSQYPASSYLSALENRYKKWVAISRGQPAPDFKGLGLDGRWVSLSNLRGKVVYIDVWATWCGPCVKEFPYSKKLEKKFEANDQVVFLYISVDKNQEVWKKMLYDDREFKGTHIIEVEGNGTSIWESYQIWGIPRYMLIDEKGVIVDANAPPPSSGEVEKEIQKLLDKR